MEHPLAGDMSQLKEEQVQEKINDLNKKLMIAYRMGNNDMINQISMMLESYRNHLKERTRPKETGQEDKIDIS